MKPDPGRGYAEQKNAPVYVVEPRTRGFSRGKFTHDTFEAYKLNLPESCVHAYCYEQNFKRLEIALGELAREKGLTVPQIALAFNLNQPLNLFSLIGVFPPR